MILPVNQLLLAGMQSLSDDQRLWSACGLAALLHLALLFGLRFGIEPAVPHSLEVSLVTVADGSSSLAARVLAPVTHTGGGSQKELRARQAHSAGMLELAGTPGASDLRRQTPMAARGNTPQLIASVAPGNPAPLDGEDTRSGQDAVLSQARREAAGNVPRNAQFNQAAQTPSDGSMGSAHGVTTRAHKEALYRDSWRKQVERAGAANFPWSALALGKPQSLTLSVTVRADGTVSRARVLRSSGQPVLDKAALDILRLAAPFPVFPEHLRREIPDMSFIYEWEFLPGDHSELRVGRP